MSLSRARFPVGLAILAMVTASACAASHPSGHGAPAAALSGPPSAGAASAGPPVYPLTGQLAPTDDPARLARPAVTVKIDNIADARPQSGIDKADIVYEEFTEGITRFIAVFQSQDADKVGPVRSVRPADPSIITPLGGVLGFSGGSPAAVDLAKASPLTLVTEEDAEVMWRTSDRVAPHNLYTSTDGLRSRAPAGAHAPPPFAKFLPAGQTFSGAGAAPATHIGLVPATYSTVAYDWDAGSGTWKRTTDGTPHTLDDGAQLAPTTVVLQFAPYSVFVSDDKVMYPEVIGSGDAWVFANGMVVKGHWSKDSATSVTTFVDSAGSPILFPPGQTWVHLIPPDSPVDVG